MCAGGIEARKFSQFPAIFLNFSETFSAIAFPLSPLRACGCAVCCLCRGVTPRGCGTFGHGTAIFPQFCLTAPPPPPALRRYVSAYKMSFTHPATEETEALFCDMQPDQTMFRIVVKSNLTAKLALHLLKTLQTACEFLDEHSANFITHKMKKRMSVAPGAHLNC